MQEYSFNNGLHNGNRTPRLWLAKGIAVAKFEGEAIPGFCAIAGADYTKNGKWSHTTYRLALAPGIRPLYFLAPMHGTWGQDLTSWGEVAQKLGLPVDVAQQIIRTEYKRTAARLDGLEAFALEVEQTGASVETVVVSFGSPTNRQIAAGWWDEPKKGFTSDGRKVIVEPGPGPNWSKPVVLEPSDATVISSTHSPGMHGGYWSVEVAVPV
jgi:hypothetical protein